MRIVAWILLLSLSAQATAPITPAVFSNFAKLSKEEQKTIRSLVDACSDPKMTQIITLTAEERKFASAPNKNLAKVVINLAPENSSSSILFDCEAVGVGPFNLKGHPELRPSEKQHGQCEIDPASNFSVLTKFARDQLYRAELARCEVVGTRLFSAACLKEIGCNVIRSVTTGSFEWVLKQFGPSIDTEKKSCLGLGQDNCMSSLVDGLTNELWGMVEGLWSGVKWVGSKLVDGTEWVYDYFANSNVEKIESDVSKKLIAAKAMTESQLTRFMRDPIGFLKESVQKMMGWLMEQVEPYARKGEIGWKCATCDQILNAGCRIAGMIGGEVLVAYFTGGVLNLAAKAGKIPKIAEILSALAKFGQETAMGRALVLTGKAVGRFAKAVLYLPGKAFETLSNIPGIKQFVHLNDQAFMRGFLGKEGFLKLEEAKRAQLLLRGTEKKLGTTLSPEEKAFLLENPDIKWAKLSKEEIRTKLDSFKEVPPVASPVKVEVPPVAAQTEVVVPKLERKVLGADGLELTVADYDANYLMGLTKANGPNTKFRKMDTETFNSAIANSPVKKATALDTGKNPSYVLELDNGAVGIYKPKQTVDSRAAQGHTMNVGDHRNEVVASAVDNIFGLGIVPKTTFKTISVNGVNVEGSFMLFEDGARVAKQVKLPLAPAEAAKLDVFDYLIENVDRHTGNFMITNKGEVRAIDNGITFWQGEVYADKKLAEKGINVERTEEGIRGTRTWGPNQREEQWSVFPKTRGTFVGDPAALKSFLESPAGTGFYQNLSEKNYQSIYQDLKREVPQLSENELKAYTTRIELRRKTLLEALKAVK